MGVNTRSQELLGATLEGVYQAAQRHTTNKQKSLV